MTKVVLSSESKPTNSNDKSCAINVLITKTTSLLKQKQKQKTKLEKKERTLATVSFYFYYIHTQKKQTNITFIKQNKRHVIIFDR